MPAHGIMFHHFHGAGHSPAQGSISADALRRMIHVTGVQNILPAREFLNRASANMLRPTDVCLTFDDNLRCQYDIALPVLREFGLTAFWFIYTGPFDGQFERLEIYRAFRTQRFASVDAFYNAFETILGEEIDRAMLGFDPARYLAEFPFYTNADRRFRYIRDEVLGPRDYHAVMDHLLTVYEFDVRQYARSLWMTPGMIREMHDSEHVIGLHSHTHPTRLERLSVADQVHQYQINFEQICEITGEAPRAMSHPCNSYNADTLAILRDLGIVLGFRANMAKPDLRGLEYPREDHANLIQRMAA